MMVTQEDYDRIQADIDNLNERVDRVRRDIRADMERLNALNWGDVSADTFRIFL